MLVSPRVVGRCSWKLFFQRCSREPRANDTLRVRIFDASLSNETFFWVYRIFWRHFGIAWVTVRVIFDWPSKTVRTRADPMKIYVKFLLQSIQIPVLTSFASITRIKMFHVLGLSVSWSFLFPKFFPSSGNNSISDPSSSEMSWKNLSSQ